MLNPVDRPNMDRLALTESVMCLGGDASGFLSDYHRSRSQICVNPCTPSNARRNNLPEMAYGPIVPVANASFSVRNLGDSESDTAQGPDGEPSWGMWFPSNTTCSSNRLSFFSLHGSSHHKWIDVTRVRTNCSDQFGRNYTRKSGDEYPTH